MNKILFALLFSFISIVGLYAQDTSIHKVIRIVDGDTFDLDNKEKVRVIGIDTPEKWDSKKLDKDAEDNSKDKSTIIALGKLASEHATELLLNKTVTLISDETNLDKDRYGRWLRYVYMPDGTLFNLKMIQDGYAYAYTKFPFKLMEQFRQAMREVREGGKGLWGDVDFNDMGK